MNSCEKTPSVAGAEWSHQTSLAPEAVSVFLAEAFDCHHLGQQRLFHLLDEAREVASALADAARRGGAGLSMTLSGSGTTVSLHVHQDAPTGRGPCLRDTVGDVVARVGSPRPDWVAHEEPDGSERAWVGFEARPGVHAVRVLWRSSEAAGARPPGEALRR